MPDAEKKYKGEAQRALDRFGVRVWSEVMLSTAAAQFHGIILPRQETADDRHIVLKLNSGYNVGIHVDKVTEILTQSDVRSLKVVYMEVPCCRGLYFVAERALAASGKQIPFESVMIEIGA